MLTEQLGAALTMRPMHAGDIAPAMDLVRMAGWSQTEADWRMMLAGGEGYGIEDEHGRLVASSMVLPYAPGIGWIGMVLVDEANRRRGYATRLLGNAIDRIQTRGMVPMLDATPAGRAVYLGLGFRDLAGIGRWRGAGGRSAQGTAAGRLWMSDAAAAAGVAADREAFGAGRAGLLNNLRSRPDAIALAMPAGRGWLWSRAGRTATQIGPVIAGDAGDAVALCATALDAIEGPVLIDIPDRESDLIDFVRSRGFALERSLTRMALEGNPPIFARSMRAIAGPELG